MGIMGIIFEYINTTTAGNYVPDLKESYIFKSGDLNIAGYFDIHHYDQDTGFCSSEIYTLGIYRSVAFMYAIEQINANDAILPNVSLGYVIFDNCWKDKIALARSMFILPDKKTVSSTCQNDADWRRNCLTGSRQFDVVGVVGPGSSSSAIMVSPLLSLFHKPMISYFATANQLSDKNVHPYFFRTVPPDKYQVETMIRLLLHFKWSYIAAVFSQGGYGTEGVKHIQERVASKGICFETLAEIRIHSYQEDYDMIVRRLILGKSKVVIVFANTIDTVNFIDAVSRAQQTDKYVFIFSDSITSIIASTDKFQKIPVGSFGVTQFTVHDPGFEKYYRSMRTLNISGDLTLFDDIVESSCSPHSESCSLLRNSSDLTVSLVIDSVYAYANALHTLIVSECLNTSKNVRTCVTGSLLRSFLGNVSFEGLVGKIEFDSNGDVVGYLEIRNFQLVNGLRHARRVGLYHIANDDLSMYDDGKVVWPYGFKSNSSSPPISACSEHCSPGFYRLPKDVPCCWECKRCRENEITNENRSKCTKCPQFQWPDKLWHTCMNIEPTFIHWSEPVAIGISTLASIGIIVTIIIFVIFTYFRNSKLIKASSTEIMYMILLGIFCSLFLCFVFFAKPSMITCQVTQFGFHVSFTFTYAPLMVKTRRIFSIFYYGSRTKRPPRFVNSKSQIVIASILITVQVFVCVLIAAVEPPHRKLYMRILTVKKVELGCDTSMRTTMICVSYNLILIIACTYYAIRSRKVPENFNESRFISFSVYTTLILWLVFIPTFFTASQEKAKVVYLTLAMIINSYVVHVCLFLPKLYAVMFVDENDIRVLQTTARNGSRAVAESPMITNKKSISSPLHNSIVKPQNDLQ
ncbi:metabotropic glutamate receptor 3-like [Tubulanus polymorphus]|uniref:metabotropic glutamate receptor 3-like n=1 Tax=Tubulanus polymorphus TaxID=672921 RepID=UPI003DA6B23B